MDPSYNEINVGLGNVATDTVDYMNSILSNPSVIIILVIVIVAYIIIFMSLGGSTTSVATSDSYMGTNYSSNSSSITVIVFAIFIVLALINGAQYFFGMDIVAKIKNLLSGNPEIDIVVDNSQVDSSNAPVPEILLKKQVFNIPENDYVYPDAKALCSAYGAKLASYEQVEDSYNDGGEWCNYGWSEGQMALFPTQQKTYDNLQKIKGHENDCGRPGINGGYMANPKLKFGVNCFGYKPKITPTESDLMANQSIYPKTKKDIAMEQRVEYWKDKLSEVLVSPFNHDTWSKL
jgi:hypothetical protein